MPDRRALRSRGQSTPASRAEGFKDSKDIKDEKDAPCPCSPYSPLGPLVPEKHRISSMSPSVDAPIPLGPFRLERRVGRGGMAEVWTGVHAAQQVPVAVKVMTGERARNPQYRAAFRNEVQSVASLDHPGIVLVFDHGEVSREAEEASRGLLPAGSPCLAMELADVGTLAAPAERSWPELRRILLALLDALAHAHARG